VSAIAGIISIASWYLFVVTIDRFWLPFSDLSAFWSQFQAGLSAIERIFALIDSKTTVHQIAWKPVSHLEGAIEFKEVSFHYSRQEQVLENFSLRIAPGERIALVGHTGAGKSSILKLLARLYEFQAGQLLIDGHDIRTLDLSPFRKQLGIVSQSPFLFAGTVADNIRYGNPGTTDADTKAMAYRIGNGNWLDSLPNGLQSSVGERGGHLSAGQRQLVALVRVLARNPSIFLLDEATANIDPFTETQIQEALTLLMRNRTSIVIAHRLSTVRSVDRIIVLEQGRIIEEGSHTALLNQGGQYAELYNMYFRHQSLDYRPQYGEWGYVAQRRFTER
jgi:ATP-binding cassette subfamily B protein